MKYIFEMEAVFLGQDCSGKGVWNNQLYSVGCCRKEVVVQH